MGGGRIVESAAVIITVLLVLGACKFGQAVLEPAIFAVFIIEIAWPLQKSLKSRIGKAAALAVTVCVTGGVILALLSLSIWGGRQIVNWITEHIERIQDILLASTSWLEEHDIFVLAMLSDRFDSTEVIRLLQVVAVRVNTILAFALIVLIYVVLGLGEMEILTARVAALKNQDASRHLLSAGARIGVKFRVYMLVRTIASAATGFAVWGFARLMGLEMAGACGVLAFALNYLPVHRFFRHHRFSHRVLLCPVGVARDGARHIGRRLIYSVCHRELSGTAVLGQCSFDIAAAGALRDRAVDISLGRAWRLPGRPLDDRRADAFRGIPLDAMDRRHPLWWAGRTRRRKSIGVGSGDTGLLIGRRSRSALLDSVVSGLVSRQLTTPFQINSN